MTRPTVIDCAHNKYSLDPGDFLKGITKDSPRNEYKRKRVLSIAVYRNFLQKHSYFSTFLSNT